MAPCPAVLFDLLKKKTKSREAKGGGSLAALPPRSDPPTKQTLCNY